MSVVGIDLGNFNSVIAVARKRGIDVICNEVSNRATPSLVSFGAKQRFLGEAAKTQELSNLKNTVGSLKRLLGRSWKEQAAIQKEAEHLGCKLVELEGGAVGAEVTYQNERKVFSITQLYAMYLIKLKETTEKELGTSVCDVVLSIPPYYTEAQRRAMMDAAEIAGLNPLRLLHDVSAAALQWGITKTDLPGTQPKHVVFVDIGQSDCSVIVSAFKKGHMAVKGMAFDRDLGGRNFDEVLLNHFVDEFKTKYKIDVRSNAKALFRLRSTLERAKKMLSANAQAPVNVECLMDDKDVAGMMERSTFEELCIPLLERIEVPIQRALEIAGLTKDQIDAVEIIGGTTRIPAVKQRISTFFNKELSTTLNQDECVAKGCALMCAIISPVFQVRDFKMEDLLPFPVKLAWEAADVKEAKEMVAFAAYSPLPCTKLLTFYRREPFDLEAFYSDASVVPEGASAWLGRYTISKIKPDSKGEAATVKVKVRLNPNGLLDVSGAQTVEELVVPVEETPAPAAEAAAAPTPMDTDEKKPEEEVAGAAAEENVPDENQKPAESVKPAAAEKAPKTKKVTRKTDAPVFGTSTAMSKDKVQQWRELEMQMVAHDKLIFDTEERRNALETYVYEMRGKLESNYAEFIQENEKETFMKQLNEMEDWLYGDGEDATKSVYVEKLGQLEKIGSPVVKRFKEAEERPYAVEQFRSSIRQIVDDAQSTDAKFEHIPQEDRDKATKAAQEKMDWLQSQLTALETQPKFQDPVVLTAKILEERDAMMVYAKSLLHKPKPKPAPVAPKAEEKPAADPAASADEKPAEEGQGEVEMKDADEPKAATEVDAQAQMDLD